VFSPANVIFAGAGVLLSVAIVLDLSRSGRSDTEPVQAAKDVIASQDALIIIFERIESFFRRLEEHATVPVTEAMKEIMVKIMVEVLEIFAIMTKEIKQGRASELIPDGMFPVADRHSERHLKKFFKKLIGRKGIEDALSKLDRLTQEEVNMATVQILKISHDIKGGVAAVGVEVKGVSDRVNRLIEGRFSTLTTHERHLKPTYDQMKKKRKLVRRKRSVRSSLALPFVAQTEVI
jgi:hypothetical protein